MNQNVENTPTLPGPTIQSRLAARRAAKGPVMMRMIMIEVLSIKEIIYHEGLFFSRDFVRRSESFRRVVLMLNQILSQYFLLYEKYRTKKYENIVGVI